MIRHFFKLIWNKKGAYSLLIIEILASFMVLFGVFTLLIYKGKNYLEPIGFNYERVWQLSLSNNTDTVDVKLKANDVLRLIQSYPQVQSASSVGGTMPFSMDNSRSGISHDKMFTEVASYSADESFAKTMNIAMTSGRWFQPSDKSDKYRPVIINGAAAEKLFDNANPIGKVLNKDYVIVGTIKNYKSEGEYMENKPSVFYYRDSTNSILIKVKPGVSANFEEQLVKTISGRLHGWTAEVSYLTELHKSSQNLTYIPVAIFGIICIFLLINVALGLFGVLNLNIAKRKGEIGLRRATGATEKDIIRQFLGEIWVLAFLSIIIGLFFAIQFPLSNLFGLPTSIYFTAILFAILLIFLIVTLCAWYPSRKASAIQPAIALHED